MSTIEAFIGRTITGVEDGERGSVLLRLDDGTAAEVAVDDFDMLAVTHLTPEVLQQRALDREAERIAREEGIRRAREAAERRRVHIEEMRGRLDPASFEKWRRETYPTTTEIVKDAWSDSSLEKQFEAEALIGRCDA